MPKQIAPYGSWASPITIEDAASAADAFFGYTIVGFDDEGRLLWLETRPAEAGRSTVVRDGVELTPAPFNARTRVHEYGGGAVWIDGGAVFASSFEDGRVYRVEDGSGRPVTPEPPQPNALRYADGFVSEGRVICVRESHGDEIVNELVSFPADGGEVTVIESGRDFYAAPRVGPDGRLSYLAWDHPLLPFIGCELWVDGKRVAGGPDEAVFQPEWGPDGALYWVSDAGDGWWNLYRDGKRLTALEAELGYPGWVFDLRTYAFLGDGRIACTVIENGLHSFAVLHPQDG